MSSDLPKLRPGRKAIIANHPHRQDIELARAAGISLARIAKRFGVGRGAVDRHWHGLSSEYRTELVATARAMESRRWQEVTAELASIATRHPDARADIEALAQRLQHLSVGGTSGGCVHGNR
jgi:AcrR family transcriptional regulator